MRNSDVWKAQCWASIRAGLTERESSIYADEVVGVFATNGGRLEAAIDEVEQVYRKRQLRYPERNLLAEAAGWSAGVTFPPLGARAQLTVPGSGLPPEVPPTSSAATTEPASSTEPPKRKRGRPPGPGRAASAAPVSSAEPPASPEPARSAARAANAEIADEAGAERDREIRRLRKAGDAVAEILQTLPPWRRSLVLAFASGLLHADDARRHLENQIAGRSLESPHGRRGSKIPGSGLRNSRR